MMCRYIVVLAVLNIRLSQRRFCASSKNNKLRVLVLVSIVLFLFQQSKGTSFVYVHRSHFSTYQFKTGLAHVSPLT